MSHKAVTNEVKTSNDNERVSSEVSAITTKIATSEMPYELGSRLRVSENGRTAEIVLLVDVPLRFFLGNTFGSRDANTTRVSRPTNSTLLIEYGVDEDADGDGIRPKLRIDHSVDDEDNAVEYYRFRWSKPNDLKDMRDAFNLFGSSSTTRWYGGAAVPEIRWPINGFTDRYDFTPHLVHSIFHQQATGQERYWLCSERVALHLPDTVPLWTKLDGGYLELWANAHDSPYVNFQYDNAAFLDYEIAVGQIVTSAGDGGGAPRYAHSLRDFHQRLFRRYLNAPTDVPDRAMIERPIWSTWARFGNTVNQTDVEQFLEQITARGLPISNLELDDKWTTHYGDFEMDEAKFPNVTRLSAAIRSAGARLTAWIHPFVNVESRNGRDESLRRYFVADSSGKSASADWWAGRGYSVDFTNDEAADWYIEQLRQTQMKYEIFSFKFDAGELDTLPHDFRLYNTGADPNEYTRAYVRNAARLGNAIEVRVGSGTQKATVFYRIMDRNSTWKDMGLVTVIPSVLHCSLNGYFWVLPDMIGGNGGRSHPSKELFIRWVQVNTLLVAMQFSIAPFDYDEETVEIVDKMLKLRQKFMPYMLKEAERAAANGQPLIRPMWWASEDPKALDVFDQFLVGDNLFAAPVVVESVRSRDVFIPEGSWFNINRDTWFVGPSVVRIEAGLDTLSIFINKAYLSTETNGDNGTNLEAISASLRLC